MHLLPKSHRFCTRVGIGHGSVEEGAGRQLDNVRVDADLRSSQSKAQNLHYGGFAGARIAFDLVVC